MRKPKKDVVIISAHRKELKETENTCRHHNMGIALHNLKFKYCAAVGAYEHNIESSYVVEIDNNSDLRTLISLAKEYDQDCVLYADKHRVASLRYPNGNIENIGRLECVDKKVATALGNYTKAGGYYYTCM